MENKHKNFSEIMEDNDNFQEEMRKCKLTEGKFNEDLKLSSGILNKEYVTNSFLNWQIDKDERGWVNQYFVINELRKIKGLLIAIAILIFLAKFF